jgi:hypothetical protein
MGASIGGNTETTFQEGIGYYGGDYDWTGFDDGTRETPDQLRLAQLGGRRITTADFSAEQLAPIGRSFVNAPLNLLQRIDVDPNVGFDISAGRLDRPRAGAAPGVSPCWATTTAGRPAREAAGGHDRHRPPGADHRLHFTSTQNNVDVNGLLGFGLEFGDHELRFTNLFVRSTQKEARIRQGVDNRFSANEVRDDFTEWFARTLISHQLTGEHEFGD